MVLSAPLPNPVAGGMLPLHDLEAAKTTATAEVAVTMVVDLAVTVTMVMVGVVLVTMVTMGVTAALETPPGLTVLMTTIKRSRWPLP